MTGLKKGLPWILVAVFVIFSAVQWYMLKAKDDRIAELLGELAGREKTVKLIIQENINLKEKNSALKKRTKALTKKLSDPVPPLSSLKKMQQELNYQQDNEEPPVGRDRVFEELSNNPEMQEVMKSRRNRILNRLYEPFFKRLNLPVDDLQTLKELLSESQSFPPFPGRMLWNRSNRPGVEISEEEREELDKSIRELLGEEMYEEYREYSESLPAQMYINRFADSLSGSNAPLDDNQREQLAGIMMDAREEAGIPSGPPFSPFSRPEDDSVPLEDRIAERQELRKKQFTIIEEKATEILNEQQQMVLKEFNESRLRMETARSEVWRNIPPQSDR